MMEDGVLHVEPEFSIPRKGINVLLLTGQKLTIPNGASWEQDPPRSDSDWSRLHVYDADHKEIAVFEPGAYGAVLYA